MGAPHRCINPLLLPEGSILLQKAYSRLLGLVQVSAIVIVFSSMEYPGVAKRTAYLAVNCISPEKTPALSRA